MHLIVYTSEFTLEESEAESVLTDIASKAKLNNPLMEITGLLFYHNRRFVQIIEGEKNSLEDLMSILDEDRRHKNVERIIDQETHKRGFKQWNMDTFNLSSSDIIKPEELKKITHAYKKNLQMDSEMLSSIYKTLLKTHGLA